MAKYSAKKNILVSLAKRRGRTYVTPEDIGTVLRRKSVTEDQVRLAALEVIGGAAGHGCEDVSLCAFMAARGRVEEEY